MRPGLLLGFLCLTSWFLVAEDPPPRLLAGLRQEQGLSLPQRDAALDEASTRRAEQLAEQGWLSHEDSDGRTAGLQLAAEGYALGTFGEVLAAGSDPERVWASWLASPSHRAVLDEPGWQRWGWGRAPRGNTWVWVLRFWKP